MTLVNNFPRYYCGLLFTIRYTNHPPIVDSAQVVLADGRPTCMNKIYIGVTNTLAQAYSRTDSYVTSFHEENPTTWQKGVDMT